MTCIDCKHFSRCAWLIGRKGTETECDWVPSRFVSEGAISIAIPDTQDEVIALVEAEP